MPGLLITAGKLLRNPRDVVTGATEEMKPKAAPVKLWISKSMKKEPVTYRPRKRLYQLIGTWLTLYWDGKLLIDKEMEESEVIWIYKESARE